MDGLRTTTYLAIFIGVTLLGPVGLGAAEKVKFSQPKRTTTIQTQPVSTIENDLPEPQRRFDNVNVPDQQAVLPANSPTVVRPKDDDQENWIFQDTQSARGIQRALGVELYELESQDGSTKTPRSDIEQYFDRGSSSNPSQITPDGLNSLDQFDSSMGNLGSGGENNDFFGNRSGNQPISSSVGLQNRGFQKTLNSPNPSIRSYYRNLYKNQIAPPTQPVVPALEAAGSQNEQAAESRTRQLYNRAAMIEAMTPKGPASVFDNRQGGLQAPAITQRENRLNTPSTERRGGKPVIPSRPF